MRLSLGLTTELLLGLARGQGLPLGRGSDLEAEHGAAGMRLFNYLEGREWRELLAVLPQDQLPDMHRGDPVLALIIARLVLEETKKLLLGKEVTPEVVSYSRTGLAAPRISGPRPPTFPHHPNPLPQPLRYCQKKRNCMGLLKFVIK